MTSPPKPNYYDILLISDLISRAVQQKADDSKGVDPPFITEAYQITHDALILEGRNLINLHFPEVPPEDRCTTKPPPCPWPKDEEINNIPVNRFNPILVPTSDAKSYHVKVLTKGKNNEGEQEIFTYSQTHRTADFVYYERLGEYTPPDEGIECILYILSQDGVKTEIFQYHFTLMIKD